MERPDAKAARSPDTSHPRVSRVLGRRVEYQQPPMSVMATMGKEFEQMSRWFNADGFKADIPRLRREHPDVRLQSLEEWLRNEGWHRRARSLSEPPA